MLKRAVHGVIRDKTVGFDIVVRREEEIRRKKRICLVDEWCEQFPRDGGQMPKLCDGKDRQGQCSWSKVSLRQQQRAI